MRYSMKKQFFPSPFSHELAITTSIGCRNNCSYCPQDRLIAAYRRRSSVNRLTLEMFKQYLAKVPPYVDIHFSGMTEPWLNLQCTDMAIHAHQSGHKLAAYTSLVGMRPPDIARLAAIPFKRFSVHVPSAGGHETIALDENYLEVLQQLLSSDIKATYHYHTGKLHPGLQALLGDRAGSATLSTRASNTVLQGQSPPLHHRGTLRCSTNLRTNILLPNGDVLVCCMDWSMKHILGNLASSNYAALYRSQEFLRVKRGLKDSSSDVLCRSCDTAEDFSWRERLRYHTDIRRYAGAIYRLCARLWQA